LTNVIKDDRGAHPLCAVIMKEFTPINISKEAGDYIGMKINI
jgi:hypothetical protein